MTLLLIRSLAVQPGRNILQTIIEAGIFLSQILKKYCGWDPSSGGRGPDWTGEAGHAPSLLANIYAWRPGEPTVGSLMTTGGAHCY